MYNNYISVNILRRHSPMNEFIIRKTYIKLMTVQIFGIVISAANSTIDVMITGIFLGSNILPQPVYSLL